MLTSLQNPLVKQLRKLHRPKERREQQLFLLEGTHLIEEACLVDYPLALVCCTPDWQEAHPDLWAVLQPRVARIELVSPEVLAAIATTTTPDGVVAAALRSSPLAFPATITLALAVETLQDPGNLGTIIRTAAAAGADGLWVSTDSVDLDHPKVLRASAGQWFRLPMQVVDLSDPIAHFKAAGGQVIATLPSADLTYWELNWQRPSLILLGNEGAGLSPELAAQADVEVTIPLMAGVESLNVAIAAALLLYEARRQRKHKT
ncbi:MAG: RNA methyltransferase [Leptolyngbyaceae cyanobacterium SL_7_1]|nr:RNA methyltransferase [Leptolyngbyaceae cyanobacterium SL_7_1]